MTRRRRRAGVLPGFAFTLGVTLFGLTLLVMLPFAALTLRALELGPGGIWDAATTPRALAAFRLTFSASLAAAALDVGIGLMVAWVLVRYRFPGRALVDALVDLPFALPTAVAGLALTTLYAENGPFGAPLRALWGLKVAFTPLGVTLALVFVGLPFAVRTVQPVLEQLAPELEEAAATLGASRLYTLRQVILPALLPSILTGFTLAFARALGEYGSVVFISGNLPMQTEILPLLIVTRLEQYDYAGATALAVAMLGASFLVLLAANLAQAWSRRAQERSGA